MAFNALRFAFRRFFGRRRLESELNEELASHIAMDSGLRVEQGESPQTARQAALRQFGNVGLVAEAARDQWGLNWLEQALRDAAYALRSFCRAPLFFIVVVVTLASGIGSSTAIFSLLDGILLRALPFPASNRLMMLWELPPNSHHPNHVLLANFAAWEQRSHSFQSMAAFMSLPMNLAAGQQTGQVPGLAVTAGFFSTLGTAPLLGRTFQPGEYWTSEPNEAVLSYSAWRQLLGADPHVIGKKILAGETYREIVGVMPPGFGLPNDKAEIYVPQKFTLDLGRDFSVIARLRPGVTPGAATAELAAIAAQTARESPVVNSGWSASGMPLLAEAVGSVRPILLVLFAAVGLVLLLACANVANLLMMRASARAPEISVRLALGAGRSRILRQLLIESLVLALCGGLLGVALGAIALHLLKTSLPQSLEIPRLGEVTLDLPVLLYAAAVSILSALLFGLAPSLHSLKRNVSAEMHRSGRSVTPGRSLRRALVVAEIAIALLLVAGAGLMVRSFLRLAGVNPGFRAENVLTARMLLLSGNNDEHRMQAVRQMLDRIRALPGVIAAGSISSLPLGDGQSSTPYYRADRPDPPLNARPSGDVSMISPGYFQAMGIPILRGRAFTAQDRAGAPRVAILNQTAARALFPGEDPIGKRIKFEWDQNYILQVVGVAAGTRDDSVSAPPDPGLFIPNDQLPYPFVSLVVRTSGDPAQLANAVRDQVRLVDSNQGISKIETMRQLVSDSIARPRLEAMVLTIFGVLALGLACLGLYGLIAFSAAQQAREIGLRVALGASRTRIFRMILGDGLRLTLIGAALGLAGVFALTRFLSSLLFQVQPLDPATLAAVILILLIVSLLAASTPAWRAIKADPASVLRQE